MYQFFVSSVRILSYGNNNLGPHTSCFKETAVHIEVEQYVIIVFTLLKIKKTCVMLV